MRVKIVSHKTAFTLVEITAVLLVLIVLATIGVASIINFSKDARQTVENETIGIIRHGISLYPIVSSSQSENGPLPASLDTAPDDSVAGVNNPFFSTVVPLPGVTDGSWYKINATTYQGPTGQRYSYDNHTGLFLSFS